MSPQLSVIEINTTPMQQFQIFLLKRPPPMMLLLLSDGIAYDFSVGRADRESTVAFLPSKGTVTCFLMYPL
jgi:hypothetical protein